MSQERALKDLVRGSLGWRDLAAHGIEVQRIPNGWAFPVYDHESVLLDPSDLLVGLRRQLEEVDGGREWAMFLLAFDLIEFGELAESPDAELLEALWDLSGGDVDGAKARLEAFGGAP